MALTNLSLNTLNTTADLFSFTYKPYWGHAYGSVIQRQCHQAYSQVLGEDEPFKPLSGGPYTFSSGSCSIGVYLVHPGDGPRPAFTDTWESIKGAVRLAFMSIFLLQNHPIGSVLNLSTGIQICIYEPSDADPNRICMTGTPYARNKALTLEECLDLHNVIDVTSDQPSTSQNVGQKETQAVTAPSNMVQQAQGVMQNFASGSSHEDVLQLAQAIMAYIPFSSQSNSLEQAQTLMADFPTAFHSDDQQQASIRVEGIPGLNQSLSRGQMLPFLKLRGDWTDRTLTAAQCEKPLNDFSILTMHHLAFASWTLREPMIYSDPPCTLGLFLARPSPTGYNTFVDSWQNIGAFLQIIVRSAERDGLGAFIDIPSGIQIVLYNGAWLDPFNRLKDTKFSSLLEELNEVAAYKRAGRLRNLTDEDRQFSTHLLQEYFHS